MSNLNGVNNLKEYNEKRECYYNIKINGEAIWVKKLRSILNSDIHKKPLGCKISDTHVKINKVHLSSFFEAQILFSHAYWIKRFAAELSKIISKETEEEEKKESILLVGYETYIEPVMYCLKKQLTESNKYKKINYCIYEEEKFTYYQHTRERNLRYFNNDSIDDKNKTRVIFLCGISTTLSTHIKMRDLFLSKCKKIEKLTSPFKYLSIIQVLPENNTENKFVITGDSKISDSEILTWSDNDKKAVLERKISNTNSSGDDGNVTTKKETIEVHFIVSVTCQWHKATECTLCYPNNVLDEKPIIETSETSVVPMQMIFPAEEKNKPDVRSSEKLSSFDFFARNQEKSFIFKDYLYYGHTVRGEHHFLYYIRTNHLFADILNDEEQKDKFIDYCKKVKEKIDSDHNQPNQHCVSIIVSPSHFSSTMFCNAINENVFGSKAHVISFDPQKEYRSNFETKYSNYAYFLEQIKRKDGKLLFYYLDDQIITGSTFYRINSLVRNLFRNVANIDSENEKIKIWDGVFTIVNRNSLSTIRDYIDEQHYYPLFNIAVSSVRSNADSCPMCKMRIAADFAIRKSVLDCNASHWMEKKYWRRIRTLDDVKEDNKNEELNERHFRRFYCENEFTKMLPKIDNDAEEIIVKTMKDICSKTDQCEYLISCIKAISRPFLYYRENVKRATLKILIGLTEGLIKSSNDSDKQRETKLYSINGEKIKKKKTNEKDEKTIEINFQDKIEKYTLLVILINSLASINSTYLFHENKIDELVNFVINLFPEDEDRKKVLSFSKSGKCELSNGKKVDCFYTVILNAVKYIILGIGGEERSQKLDKLLTSDKLSGDFKDLYKAVFLENSVNDKPLPGDNINKNDNLVKKYNNIAKDIAKKIMNEKSSKNLKININIEFLYLNELLAGKDPNANVFKIAENAEMISLCELFGEAQNNNTQGNPIFKELNTIGYFEKGNKFLFKLHHYTEEERKDEKRGVEEVYILIDFIPGEEDCGNIKRLKAIREILKYRYVLTEVISKDIKTGAIKTAIQAEGLGAYMGTSKVTSHGGSADLEILFSRIYLDLSEGHRELCSDCKEEVERGYVKIERGYNLLNLFMNHCISLGAAREYFFKYFNVEKDDPFMVKLWFCQKNSQNDSENYVINDYFKFLNQKRKDKYTLRFLWNKEEKIIGDFCEEIKILNLYPKLIDTQFEDDGVHSIFLLGFICTAIKNATEHGQKNKDNKIPIDIYVMTKEKNGNLCGYKLGIKNNKSTEYGSDGKTFRGLTKMFFCDFLNRKYKNPDKGHGYSIEMNTDPDDSNSYRIEINVGEKLKDEN